MLTACRAWTAALICGIAALALTACAGAGTGPGAAHQRAGQAPDAQAVSFPDPARVDNPMFPLVPGTQFGYRGTVVEHGEAKQHRVVFTVTDLTKKVGDVRTVVTWDRDFLEGRLQEQEVALFAQDSQGNVWNFGEYPEEFEHGRFAGAPSTWVRGVRGAFGGIHVLARPAARTQYVEGRVPAIDFYDISRVTSTGQRTCVPARCYSHVAVVDEWSPGDPAGGHQLKYYAPGAGLVRVGARGGDSQEFLSLEPVTRLGPGALARVRAAVLAMDRRGYRVSQVYRATGPAVPSASG